MNNVLRKIFGITVIVLGVISITNAVYVEDIEGDVMIAKLVRLIIGVSLIVTGYYFGIRIKSKTVKTLT